MKRIIILVVVSILSLGNIAAQNGATSGKKKSKFRLFIRNADRAITDINRRYSPTVLNPFRSLAEVELVGCFGNSASQTVKLVFTVRNKTTNFEQASFGGGSKAYDIHGRTYSMTNSPTVSLPTGVIVRYEDLTIVKVLPSVTHFELIQLSWYLSPGHHSGDGSRLEFRNIPILWDVE